MSSINSVGFPVEMAHIGVRPQTPSVGELGQLRSSNIQLRKDVDKLRKEGAACQTQLEATQRELRQSELARATTDEYARKLENVSRSG